MRLLNVFTGRLEEYFGSEIPEYAILSHTWGQEEVTFVDIQNIPAGRKPISMLWKKKDSSSDREASPFVHDQAVQEKAGYKKIYYSCTQAAHDGYQYIWIDSCCIDKSSSAELSEAINSMFQWYEKASICYAYLEDVQLETFRNARWFTRGWTLQELLAPQNVVFMGEGWTLLGTKAELASSITAVTGIDPLPLLNRDQIRRNSVAQRMSWASKRNTTRVEDAAYCLLGIFDANMPLLYGEAEDAFVRLQEEILKYSDDQSLFAWSISPDYEIDLGCGIFAQSPQNYATHSPIISLPRTSGTVPFAMTNRGLQIELPLLKLSGYTLGLLECQYEYDVSTCLGILMKQTGTAGNFTRVRGRGVAGEQEEDDGWDRGVFQVTFEQASAAETKTIYIQRNVYGVPSQHSCYQLRFSLLEKYGFQFVASRPSISQANVNWSSRSQSLHVLQEFNPSWQSIGFVFHSPTLRLSFGVYFDENESESPVEVYLSPLVDDTDWQYMDLEDWHHMLSYGLDPNGRAYPRYPIIWFRRDDLSSIDTFAIQAYLEIGDLFGQRIRILTLSSDVGPDPREFSEGEFVSNIWVPSSVSADYSVAMVVADTGQKSLDVQPTSTISTQDPPVIPAQDYSTLEVVPGSEQYL